MIWALGLAFAAVMATSVLWRLVVDPLLDRLRDRLLCDQETSP